MDKSFRFLTPIAAAFVAVLLVSNVVSAKITDLHWFIFDVGTLLFPLAYIFGDVLTEVYGYKRARSVIWLGFGAIAFMAGAFYIADLLPPAEGWPFQDAFHTILGMTPRIVGASLVAYFVGEFANSFILAKMKMWTKGKHLWSRTIGSSVVGQLLDTVIFVLIAFWGVLPNELILSIIVSNYIFKTGVEILFTPVTYAVVGFLKKKENEDYYDRQTNFNPFSAKV
jgi:queuosine precursor transporter